MQFVISKQKLKQKFDPLSKIKDEYIDSVLVSLEKYLPVEQLRIFELFNNRGWNTETPLVDQQTDAKYKLQRLCIFYGIVYEDAIYNSWISLLKQMYEEMYPFCGVHDSPPARYLYIINLIIKTFHI